MHISPHLALLVLLHSHLADTPSRCQSSCGYPIDAEPSRFFLSAARPAQHPQGTIAMIPPQASCAFPFLFFLSLVPRHGIPVTALHAHACAAPASSRSATSAPHSSTAAAALHLATRSLLHPYPCTPRPGTRCPDQRADLHPRAAALGHLRARVSAPCS
jgi:hypothetical protein